MRSRHILCEGWGTIFTPLCWHKIVQKVDSQKGENLNVNQYFQVPRNLISLLHINFFAEGNDEKGARNVSANASQSCFQRIASLQVAHLAWQGLSSSSIPHAGSYHYMKMGKGWNGKWKVLDNIFSEVSKSKNCNSCWSSCHVSDPSLVNGYCDKREVISNFHRVISKYRDYWLKDWSWFFIFGVVLGHATEQQWETAWEFIFAYVRYPIVVKWNGKYTVMMIVECQIHATWYAWLMEYVPGDWVTHEHHFQ